MFARLVIKIRAQEVTRIAGKNGIGTDYILPVRAFPLKMSVDILILQGLERPIGAFRTFISFLVT